MKHKQFDLKLTLEDGFTEVINLKNYTWFSDVLIETGTCDGAGVIRGLEAGFNEVRSVEMHPGKASISRSKFNGISNILLYEGDSRDKLAEMIPNKPCVFFLDAHPAGPETAGHEEIIYYESQGKEKESNFHGDNILREEIKIILQSDHDHVIILDDQHSINPEWISLLPNHYIEHINNKYLVCIPNSAL